MSIKTLAAAFALAAFAGSAFAGSIQVTAMTPTLGGNSVTKAAALNYDDGAPAADLYARIEKTAQALCASNRGGTGPMLARDVEKCRVKAVKRAVDEIGKPELTRIAEAK